MSRALSLTARIAFVIALVSITVWTIYKPGLTEAVERRDDAITEVVTKGPVEVEGAEWTLESLKVYKQLPDEEGHPVEIDVPAGASIVVALVSIKPSETLALRDRGFTCDSQLADDQNNLWKEQSSIFGLALPTYCSDNDHPFTPGKAAKVMKVFVVPNASLPNLVGLVTPATGKVYPDKRVLIRL